MHLSLCLTWSASSWATLSTFHSPLPPYMCSAPFLACPCLHFLPHLMGDIQHQLLSPHYPGIISHCLYDSSHFLHQLLHCGMTFAFCNVIESHIRNDKLAKQLGWITTYQCLDELVSPCFIIALFHRRARECLHLLTQTQDNSLVGSGHVDKNDFCRLTWFGRMRVGDEEETRPQCYWTLLCWKSLVLCNPAFSNHVGTENSHFFSWEGVMRLLHWYCHIPHYCAFLPFHLHHWTTTTYDTN